MTAGDRSGSVGGMDADSLPTSEPGASRAELIALAERMDKVARQTYALFYRENMGGEVHAFLEFNGLIAKYAQICQRCAAEGVDFRHMSTHTGQALPVEVHDMVYLGEKLQCIFGPIIDANPAARAALKQALFGEQ